MIRTLATDGLGEQRWENSHDVFLFIYFNPVFADVVPAALIPYAAYCTVNSPQFIRLYFIPFFYRNSFTHTYIYAPSSQPTMQEWSVSML